MNANIMRRMLLAIAVCLSSAAAQDKMGQPVIRVESALVTVPVIVSDPGGKFVGGLKADDFRLFEDGAPVPVSLFLTSEDSVKIALLIDTSTSTTTVLKQIKKAAEQFLLQLRPQDLAMVVGFDSEIRTLCPLSSDRRELKDGIKRAQSSGSRTRMRDAVSEIALKRFRSLTGRKAIILLTDGQDRGSRISADELLNTVAASNTLIYSIFYKVDPREMMKRMFGVESSRGATAAWDAHEKQAVQYLTQISELSAGRVFTSNVGELTRSFSQISGELRAQYLLGFYPDNAKLDGALHALEVSVKVPDAAIRSRRSYRALP